MNNSASSLRGDKGVHRFLLSSPAYFVGEAEYSDLYLLTPVFKDFARGDFNSSLISFSIRLEDSPETPRILIPSYEYLAQDLSSLLSVYYGKLIESLGYTEKNGINFSPTQSVASPYYHPQRNAFNGNPRKATMIDLNLGHAHPLIESLFDPNIPHDSRVSLIRACRFYQAALKMLTFDPVLSYTLLISAIEALTILYQYSEDELCDDQLRGILDKIEKNVPNPAKTIKFIKSRLYQIKRKCSAIIKDRLDQDFFENPECIEPFYAMSPDTAVERFRAAYDLRSMFLHTGKTQGVWVDPFVAQSAEIIIGEPVIENDKQLKKLVMAAPTWTGLERMVQYSICGVMHDLFLPI